MILRSRLYSFAPLVLFLAATFFTPAIAKADPVTFALQGTFADGTLTGTVIIDTASGTVTSANATAVVTASTFTFSSATDSLAYASDGIGLVSPSATLYLALPTTSLVGYAGGSVCTGTNLCPGNGTSFLVIDSPYFDDSITGGTLTPQAATPEPSSLLLLATGLLTGAGTCLRRLGSA